MARTLYPSTNAAALIREFEGLRLKSYPDPGSGGAPWTVGYGHTGPEVRPGMTITKREAEEMLALDLKEAAQDVRRLTKESETSQQQFDALVSFQFNTGKLHGSTLLRKHRDGDRDATVREFHRWIYASGRKLPGLIRRRAAEAALYASDRPGK